MKSTVVIKGQLEKTLKSPTAEKERGKVVILSSGTFATIKRNAGQPDFEYEARRKQEEDSRLAVEEKARERRSRLLKLEAESNAQEFDVEAALASKKPDPTKVKALNEGGDVKKQLDQLAMAAKAMAVRDTQLHTKKEIRSSEKDNDKKWDDYMKEECKKAVEVLQERDNIRKNVLKSAAEVLSMQISEREHTRLVEQEQREAEGEALKLFYEKLREEEEYKAREKVELGKKAHMEIINWNEQQLREKERLTQMEKEEEYRLLKFIEEKNRQERQIEEQKERIRKGREMEWAKMRSNQEKIMDHRAEKDELMARRHQEAKDREWRERERAEAQRNAGIRQELAIANQEFQRMRVEAKQAAHDLEKQEMERNEEIARKEKELQRMEKELRHQRQDEYKHLIDEQVSMKRTVGKDRLAAMADEERDSNLRRDAEVRHFETLKQRKLQELRNAGVPDKYLVDILRAKA